MELCWCCPSCLQERTNLGSNKLKRIDRCVVNENNTVSNNNISAKKIIADDSTGVDVHDDYDDDAENVNDDDDDDVDVRLLGTSPTHVKHVTFADNNRNTDPTLFSSSKSYFGAYHLDPNALGLSANMCVACECQKLHSMSSSGSSESAADQGIQSQDQDPQTGYVRDMVSPVKLEQYHVIQEEDAVFGDEMTNELDTTAQTLPQLIADMLIPCDVLVNNRNGVIPVETDSDEVQNLFVDAFLHNNRLEHMIQVMGYHPHYLESFLKTQQYLLRGDGPLPYDYRHYIAIMAAGRHQCSYIIKIQMTEFLLQGGDERWLRGLEHVPQKLRDFYEINKILAHRPWLLDKSHIEKLTRGTENWSLSELMHAIALLAHFHALASFVYGCGVNAEIDQEEGHTYRMPSVTENGASTDVSGPTTPNSSLDGKEGCIEELMRKMRQLTEEAAAAQASQEELLKRFEKIESQSAELPPASKQPSVQADLLRYVQDPDFMYEDFARRGQPNKFPCFRAQDYSWEEQGFSLANRLYTDIGTYLDEKFRVAYDLTYNTMGHCTDVDTTSFRRAIWNYIHSMFGIRHDDYDYNEVNQLMERSLKAYIKTVTCFPERVTKHDYDSFMKEFKHSEKVHVNLMLLEAKMQAELLYALRAIMKYMT